MTKKRMNSKISGLKRINYSTAISVVVGIALFGGLQYVISRLPSNELTRPVKKAADIAARG